MRKDDILRLPQLGRSINSSSIEGFLPSLSAVGATYGGDLCPEGILGLSYTDVVAMLLSLISFFLSFGLVLLSLHSGFFSLISELFSLLQLLLLGNQLFLGSSQLLFSLICQLLLALGLLLSILQGCVCALPSLLLSDQLLSKISIAVFSNSQGLHNSSPPFPLLIQLLKEGVGHLL